MEDRRLRSVVSKLGRMVGSILFDTLGSSRDCTLVKVMVTAAVEASNIRWVGALTVRWIGNGSKGAFECRDRVKRVNKRRVGQRIDR